MQAIGFPSTASGRSDPQLSWLLRIGMAGCYIGHGAFGVITKAAWVPYFTAVGLPESWAWRLMRPIGVMDIIIGILALVWPSRALFGWATCWTVVTAFLRPLAGEPFWEFLERAGNYGLPLALYVLAANRPSIWEPLRASDPLSGFTQRRVRWILQLTTATLLVGHAGCVGVVQKPVFAVHYAILGGSLAWTPWIGLVEVTLAALALLRPRAALLGAICLWKIGSEILFPMSGAPIWEFVERFGSYLAPLSLAWLLLRTSDQTSTSHLFPSPLAK